jgi:hypothetical protein
MATKNIMTGQTDYVAQENLIVLVAGLLIYLVLFGAAGMWLGEMRKRAFEGAVLGCLLGPIGLIIIMLLPMGQERERASRVERSSSGGGLAWRDTKEARDYAKKSR